MSDNVNQPISRTGSDNSGNGGHLDQGGRRNNPSGNRNNRRRRPSQQIGGEQSANHSQRPAANNPGVPAQQNAHQNTQQNAQAGRQQQNPSVRQDPYQQRRPNNRPQRPNQVTDVRPAAGSNPPAVNVPQNTNRSAEKPEHGNEKQIPVARNEKQDNQAFGNRKNTANQPLRTERPREPRTWARNIRTEETHEDIHRENERIEKEIWLEISGIHTFKLD